MSKRPGITASFRQRKEGILKQLSVPSSEYQDKSPKGSIDSGIRHLIDDINRQEGLMTTSSCAGRISVFLEGRKKPEWTPLDVLEDETRAVSGKASANGPPAGDANAARTSKSASSGGKGGGGTWLYISHDPVLVPYASEDHYFHKLLGLCCDQRDLTSMESESLRYVHFKFEPMILHVLTASLVHAQMVLMAASQSGFRESGAINLVGANGEQPMPMVGVRCLGLGFDSIVGYLHEEDDTENYLIQSLVTETYLHTLINLANGKFVENSKRTESFRTTLLQLCSSGALNEQTAIRNPLKVDWEDGDSRRERKRAEGLRRQQELRDMKKRHTKETETSEVERIESNSSGQYNAQHNLANT